MKLKIETHDALPRVEDTIAAEDTSSGVISNMVEIDDEATVQEFKDILGQVLGIHMSRLRITFENKPLDDGSKSLARDYFIKDGDLLKILHWEIHERIANYNLYSRS
jgi:uncharacterized ubiquitin-like protein YukD